MNCGIKGGKEAPGPHARIAAIHSPCWESRGCPTAYTPGYLRCNRPFAARFGDRRVPEPGTYELGSRDRAVLTARDGRDQGVQRGG